MLDPDLLSRLEGLVDPLSRGDPEAPLRWTVKSTRTLAAELKAIGQPISHEKVAQLLQQMDFSLQRNRKIEEGTDHPNRDAQFRHISGAVRRALALGAPVISVDTKTHFPPMLSDLPAQTEETEETEDAMRRWWRPGSSRSPPARS